MCRMIFAVGNININSLIEDFITLASDQNEKHEKNLDKEFKHGDGWGIAYLENNEFKIFRSTRAVYEDPQIEQFKNLAINFLILHARKASQGNVVLENVHPFEQRLNGHHYLFSHNGTIRDELLFDNQFQRIGTTDSERLFFFLLTNSNGELIETDLPTKLKYLKDFTAANFILSDGEKTYLTSWYSENPKYYTLKVLDKTDAVIVASEVLPHYKKENWERLENHDIISVRTSRLNLKKIN